MKPEGRVRRGSPAIGVGTTSAAISSGSAACGACRRPISSGCPAIGKTVPGQGFQRISGYWMPANVEETTYLPQPQQSLETGPTSRCPGPNYFWVPGNWKWRDDRYVWQPGYWAA